MNIASITQDTVTTVSRFFETPAGKAITREALQAEEARTLEERRTLVQDIAALEAADLAAIHAHENTVGPLDREIAALKALLKAAETRRLACRRRRGVESYDASIKLDTMRGRMEATAPREQIRAFEDEMHERLEGLRLQIDAVTERCIDGKYRQTWNNNPSFFSCCDAITSAIRAARALAADALDAADLEARFEALRRAIPAVDVRPSRYSRAE